MGKLAERFTDAARSGVYRVYDADIPRAAAEEAGALLLELGVAALADGGWNEVERGLAGDSRGICVVLVPDAAVLAGPGQGSVLAALAGAARSRREAGRPFFAVLVDPAAHLALPPLYREKAPT